MAQPGPTSIIFYIYLTSYQGWKLTPLIFKGEFYYVDLALARKERKIYQIGESPSTAKVKEAKQYDEIASFQ